MSSQDADQPADNDARNYERRWKGYLKNTHDKMMEVLMPDLSADDIILDASAGTGLLADRLLERDAPFNEYILNDISPRNLEVAQHRLPDDPRILYTSHSAEDLPFEENRFTRVICLNALHNYERPSVAVRQFKDILKPNGKLYLIDWNRTGWFNLVNMVIRWSTNEIINTMSRDETVQMLRDHRFRIEHSRRWRYRYWRLYLVVGGFQYWKER